MYVVPTTEQWGFMSEYHRARFAIDILNNCDAVELPEYIGRWITERMINGLPETAKRMTNDDVAKGRVRL